MELIELKNNIISAFTGSKEDLDAVLTMVDGDHAIFPFNDYEHLIKRNGTKSSKSTVRKLESHTRSHNGFWAAT